MRLYRHALESIFVFATLAELHVIMRVCKEWCLAIGSMKACRFKCELPQVDVSVSDTSRQLASICNSPLARHIDTLKYWRYAQQLSGQNMALIYERLPHLTSLSINPVADAHPAAFPPSLTLLHLCFDYSATLASIQATIETTAQLSQLQYLQLGIRNQSSQDAICFAPLARLQHLTTLQTWTIPLSMTHVREISTIRHLRKLECIRTNVSVHDLLTHLKQPIQLTSLQGFVVHSETDAEALTSFPLLTKLSASWIRVPHVDFLLQMPELEWLHLTFESTPVQVVDVTRVAVALRSCTHLTKLSLGAGIIRTGAQACHIFECLRVMPLLESLDLWMTHGLAEPVDAHTLVAVLQTCTGLQRLMINCRGIRITSEQLHECLQCMPVLEDLSFIDAPASLSWTSAGTLPKTLTHVSLHGILHLIPAEELPKLHTLAQLQDLHVSPGALRKDCEDSHLALQTLHVPSVALPLLRTFSYCYS
jgi:hypothetical protein